MTTRQTIKVEGLPEGFELKNLKIHIPADTFSKITKNTNDYDCTINYVKVNADVVLRKIKPRRIVLEEVKEGSHTSTFVDDAGCWTYWREVKETDLTLTNDEPKLSLSVDKCKQILGYGDSYQSALNELAEFIKDK